MNKDTKIQTTWLLDSFINIIRVMQAHQDYLSEHDKKRLAGDLQNRGLNVEETIKQAGEMLRAMQEK